jgi:hypothetical protein
LLEDWIRDGVDFDIVSAVVSECSHDRSAFPGVVDDGESAEAVSSAEVTNDKISNVSFI